MPFDCGFLILAPQVTTFLKVMFTIDNCNQRNQSLAFYDLQVDTMCVRSETLILVFFLNLTCSLSWWMAIFSNWLTSYLLMCGFLVF
jgi:hypothetical protein